MRREGKSGCRDGGKGVVGLGGRSQEMNLRETLAIFIPLHLSFVLRQDLSTRPGWFEPWSAA